MSDNSFVQEQIIEPPKQRKIKWPLFLLGLFIFVWLVLFLAMDFVHVVDSVRSKAAVQDTAQDADSENQGFQLSGAAFLGLLTSDTPQILSDNNFTGILIGGVDARNVEIRNGEFINTQPEGQAGLRNIDTVMQLVLDHRTNEMLLISIPRDMGVDVRLDCFKFSGSFHWLYDKGMSTNCPEKGIGVLKAGVEAVTGFKSQYHVIVTLDAFQEIIQIVGEENDQGEMGIYVDNPRGFSELYPDDDQMSWDGVYFPQGHLFLTPYRALQYARTRQYTGDWDRAARQQRIVKAVMDRFVSMNVLANPSKIQSLIKLFNKKVLMSAPKDLAELQGILATAAGFDINKLHKVVIDTSFGGEGNEAYMNKQPHDRPGGPYYMVPTKWAECPGNEFCKIHEKLQSYFADPSTMP